MFKFLKKTLGKALGKFKKDAEEKAEVIEEVEEIPRPTIEKQQTSKASPSSVNEQPKETKKESPQKVEKKEESIEIKEQTETTQEKKESIKEEEAPPVKKEISKEPAVVQETTPEVKEPVKIDTPAELKKEPKKQEPEKEKEEPIKEKVQEETPKLKKKGFFGFLKEKVSKFKLSKDKFDDVFWDLEVALLENNVAVEVIEKIKKDLKEVLTKEPIPRNKFEKLIIDTLKHSIEDLFDVEPYDLLQKVKDKKPFVIAMIGVNGAGKTTALAKLVKLFQNNNLTCVAAASDTFRAAAIQQLEEHTTKLGIKLIKSEYKSDPAAVAFDAIEHAKAKGLDVVLIDTAGRLHSNTNLMEELKKIIRVSKPDLKLFVGESITGNDCVEQAKIFDELVGIDGIILSKADVDEKGGAAVSVSYITKKPILFIGTGQTYDDLKPFNADVVLESLGL